MRIHVQAPVRPSEDADKVQAAATAWWPDAAVVRHPDGVEVTATDAATFRQRVWELRIIDTLRSALLAGVDAARPERIHLRLSKQAAVAGKVSLPAAAHPLGDLDITITVEAQDPWQDAQAFSWWLCPETKDGEIVAGSG